MRQDFVKKKVQQLLNSLHNMTKHHHNLALKNAIFAHWNKYEIYTDNWQEIQKFEQKKTTDK